MHQDLYEKAKTIVKRQTCMKIYDAARPLHLENDAFGISLAAGLLQVRDGIDCGHDEASDNVILQPIAFASRVF